MQAPRDPRGATQYESPTLVAIRHHAPFRFDFSKLCVHAIIALVCGASPHFVADYYTLWPVNERMTAHGTAQCVLCAAGDSTRCVLVDRLPHEMRSFNRLNPVLPADEARREAAEAEILGRIWNAYRTLLQDAEWGARVPRRMRNAQSTAPICHAVHALRQCIITHAAQLTTMTPSMLGPLYTKSLFPSSYTQTFSSISSTPRMRLVLAEENIVMLEVRSIHQVVRTMEAAIQHRDTGLLLEHLAIRGNPRGWEALWVATVRAACAGRLSLAFQPVFQETLRLYPSVGGELDSAGLGRGLWYRHNVS